MVTVSVFDLGFHHMIEVCNRHTTVVFATEKNTEHEVLSNGLSAEEFEKVRYRPISVLPHACCDNDRIDHNQPSLSLHENLCIFMKISTLLYSKLA
jgi:hypothetical protein